MGDSPSIKMRFLGALAGLFIGAVIGALVGMGFNNSSFAAVVGGCIGLIVGFCFPKAAGFIFGGFIDLP
jgi:hypothetical protein